MGLATGVALSKVAQHVVELPGQGRQHRLLFSVWLKVVQPYPKAQTSIGAVECRRFSIRVGFVAPHFAQCITMPILI